MFTMSLHEKDKDLLIRLKDYLGVVSIIKHGTSSLQYKIRSVKGISILISLRTAAFNNFPLISHKKIDF
jgi:hypothetical protein